MRIESKTIRGIKGASDSVCVDLAGLEFWYEYVPIVIRPMRSGIKANDSRRSSVIVVIKEQEFNLRGIAGKDTEVDATITRGCA